MRDGSSSAEQTVRQASAKVAWAASWMQPLPQVTAASTVWTNMRPYAVIYRPDLLPRVRRTALWPVLGGLRRGMHDLGTGAASLLLGDLEERSVRPSAPTIRDSLPNQVGPLLVGAGAGPQRC